MGEHWGAGMTAPTSQVCPGRAQGGVGAGVGQEPGGGRKAIPDRKLSAAQPTVVMFQLSIFMQVKPFFK